MIIYYLKYNPGKYYIAIFKDFAKFSLKLNECEWIIPGTIND